MQRIAIIGNSGGGKTTLSKQLSQHYNLPLHIIDLLQWQAGWVPTPKSEFDLLHANLIAGEHWVIDGWGNWEALETRFSRADTIVFVDFPLYIHYWWSLKRQVKYLFRPREDLPPDCPMLPMTWQLLKLIWHVHYQMRPKLIDRLQTHKNTTNLIWLRSPRERKMFMETLRS